MDQNNTGFRPAAIKIITVVNSIAAILHIIFWTLAFIKLPSPLSFSTLTERANMAVSYGFGFADILWSIPLLIISAIGLWKLQFWGWFASQLVNMCWMYSFTVLLTKDLYTKAVTPGTIIFLPFALFSICIGVYLWKKRYLFIQEISRNPLNTTNTFTL